MHDVLRKEVVYLKKKATDQSHRSQYAHSIRDPLVYSEVFPVAVGCPSLRFQPMATALIDELQKVDCFEIVCLDSAVYFRDRLKRNSFAKECALPMKCFRITHAHGNYLGNLHFYFHVPLETAIESPEVKRTLGKTVAGLPKYSTRAMRKAFYESVDLLQKAGAKGRGYSDMLYAIATGDQSAPETVVQKALRERLIALLLDVNGDSEIAADLRSFNGGPMVSKFDAFWGYAAAFVDNYKVAQDRRQAVGGNADLGYLPIATSMQNFIDSIVVTIPENERPSIHVPTVSWVALNMTPSDSTVLRTARYTGRLNIVFKLQQRSVRSPHPDAQYGSAIQKYSREWIVAIRDELRQHDLNVTMLSVDDKALIIVGEPGHALAPIARMRPTMGPAQASSTALDHDTLKKIKIVPSIILDIAIPESANGSFRKGQVLFQLRDNAFFSSTQVMHVASMMNYLLQCDRVDSVLLVQADGGADHNFSHVSVQAALIALAMILKLDILLCIRTVAGHSWCNPVERVMSIFNLALNGTSLARPVMDERNEAIMAKCTGLGDIRAQGESSSDFKDKVIASVDAVVTMLSMRFEKCELKGVSFQRIGRPEVDDIDHVLQKILSIDPSIDLKKLNKKGVSNCTGWHRYFEKHIKISLYALWFSKCTDLDCCPEIKMPADVFSRIASKGFPLPIPDRQNHGHYSPFAAVYGQPIDASHCPSLSLGAENAGNSQDYTAQKARDIIVCRTCRKPRVIYSRLAVQDKEMLEDLKLEINFSCGTTLIDTSSSLESVRAFVDKNSNAPVSTTRPVSCSSPIE